MGKNRMQRRAEAAAERRVMQREYATNATIRGMIQNGIQPQDLTKEYNKGFDNGYRAAAMPMFKTCIAAVCLATREETELTDDQIWQVASSVGNKIIYCLNNQDMVDEVLEKTGIEINMNDALEPVKQTDG